VKDEVGHLYQTATRYTSAHASLLKQLSVLTSDVSSRDDYKLFKNAIEPQKPHWNGATTKQPTRRIHSFVKPQIITCSLGDLVQPLQGSCTYWPTQFKAVHLQYISKYIVQYHYTITVSSYTYSEHSTVAIQF